MRNGKLEVWYADADQIPWLLQESGRLRELTFRQVGEGTGKSADLDLFDSYYLHLFVWDSESQAVIGGYRLGEGDRILARFGSVNWRKNYVSRSRSAALSSGPNISVTIRH